VTAENSANESREGMEAVNEVRSAKDSMGVEEFQNVLRGALRMEIGAICELATATGGGGRGWGKRGESFE